MKKSVKIIAVILVLALAIGGGVFAFMSNQYGEKKKADVVLITNSSIEDDSKTNGLWHGVKSYGKEHKMRSNYLEITSDDNSSLDVQTIGKYIDIAVGNGAQIIVLPDENFAVAAYELAPTYKDVKFLLVDAIPHSQGDTIMRTISNVMPVKFDYLEAGFLAGYSCVQDGYTNLGFVGSSMDESTGDYAGGFKQGATYAAQQKNINVVFDYAEYDSLILDYDYSMLAKAVYEPVSENAHKLTVVDGYGTGCYNEGQVVSLKANEAPKNKVFDHWEVKSDTDGVASDSVVLSDVSNPEECKITVGQGDCTVTAVYKDAITQEVTINNVDGSIYKTLNVPENTTVKIEAPAAGFFLKFKSWECNFNDAVDDKNSSTINLSVSDKPIVLTPKYDITDVQTIDLLVDNGSGSGSYNALDKVSLVANAPADGYMFAKWEITANNGDTVLSDIDYTNPNLTFNMPNRYASLPQKLFDNGVEILFTNDSMVSDSIFANGNANQLVFSINANDKDKANCAGYIEYDYQNLIKLAIDNFAGGAIFSGSTENKCIKLSNKSFEARTVDEKGKEVNDENYDEDFALAYANLADKKIALTHVKTGADMRNVAPSKNVEFNYWIKKS